MHKIDPAATGIQVIFLTEPVARRLAAHRTSQTFSAEFRRHAGPSATVGPGDVLEVSIVEAPPASLFGGGSSDGVSKSQSTTLPDQMINSAGTIDVPFAGRVQAAGRTVRQIEEDIVTRLQEKANQPQVLVRVINNNSDDVTILGAVPASTRMPLTARREKLLDALAKAGGASEDLDRLTIQVTRGSEVVTVPVQKIVRDPKQNIVLRGGDIITVEHQPFSFTVLGATGRNDEIRFEGSGINLSQALARSAGLNDARANARGVFVFRFESEAALDPAIRSVAQVSGGKVRVIYWLDLSAPASLFAAKTFPVNSGDILYVANAPAAELQKFVNIVGALTSPGLNATSTTINASH